MHVVKSFLIAIALHLITQVFFVTHANASYYNTCVFQVQIKETGKVDPDGNVELAAIVRDEIDRDTSRPGFESCQHRSAESFTIQLVVGRQLDPDSIKRAYPAGSVLLIEETYMDGLTPSGISVSRTHRILKIITQTSTDSLDN